MVSKTYDEILLGNAPETILAGSDRLMPTIGEGLFVNEVLPILENPFGTDKLDAYSRYVGELTKPLNVLSDEDPTQILFSVPALVQSPATSISTKDGLTAEHFMQSLRRDAELGRDVNGKIHGFMMRLTQTRDYRKTVLEPLQEILARYGRKLKLPPNPNVPDTADAKNTQGTTPTTSSFTDEYED